MGFWNATLYGNDLSLDIKETFEIRINQNNNYKKIYYEMTNEFAECILSDDAPLFWIVFADCLWEYGLLSIELKLKVLSYIEGKVFYDNFESSIDKKKWLDSLDEVKRKFLLPYQGNKKTSKLNNIKIPWNVGDIYAYKFVKKTSNILYNKYIVIQKIGESFYGDSGTRFSIIQVFNKVFDILPNANEIINLSILPLTLKFDFYDFKNITNEQKEIMEWNISTSLRGYLHLYKTKDYKPNLFTYIGNKSINEEIKFVNGTYLDYEDLEEDLFEYFSSWNKL